MTPHQMNMTVNQLLDFMEEIPTGATALVSMPTAILVNEHDARAATLLKQFAEEDLTVGQVLKILRAATWWMQLWASMPKENETPT